MEEINEVSLDVEKFSYSKLNTFEQCSWRYKLHYIDQLNVDESSVATDFGTLVHYIEESIAREIIETKNLNIDKQKYIDMFININTENVLGIEKLKEKWQQYFFEKDKLGYSYEDKADLFLKNGIFSLVDRLAADSNLEVLAVEQPFEINHNGYTFHGFIDRILRNNATNQLIIEDIKTWDTIKNHDLKIPLQFVFYVLAAKELYQTDNIICSYDLPLLNELYLAGEKDFIEKGLIKINELLTEIQKADFQPNPTPLCHWCPYSRTYLYGQDENVKNACLYYLNWTRENKDFSVNEKWQGLKHHKQLIENLNKIETKVNNIKLFFDENKISLFR